MKKTLLIASLLLCSMVMSFAQDAKQIVERYAKETNMVSMNTKAEQSIFMDFTMTMANGGINMNMGMKVIVKTPSNKMKIDMDMNGQQMLIVTDGKQGWMKMAGSVQPIPKDQLAQMTSQGDMMKNFNWDPEKFNFEYLGAEGDLHKVKIINKDAKADVKELVAKFSKTTGLLESADMKVQGMDMTYKVAEYKTFGKLKIPAKMKMIAGGNEMANITVNKFEMDYPTTDQMFTEPK